jgi:ER lumen protein retaining receptor
MLSFINAIFPASAKTSFSIPTPVLCAYVTFGAVGFTVFHTVSEKEPSSVLTMSALAQCLGITMLCIQSFSSGSAAGISAKSLMLDAFAISFRLCSTLWLAGYLPSDRSGDFLYQAFDVCSLLLLIFLLHRVLVVHRGTYQSSDDSLRVGPMVLVCLGLAALLHGDMDDNAIFDTLWLAGLFASVVAVLPQFWLITSSGGWTGALTSHYIAAMAMSRLLSGCFMWMARNYITCAQYIHGVEHTIIAIFAAHIVHGALLCDFGFHYGCSVMRKGVLEPVQLTFDV